MTKKCFPVASIVFADKTEPRHFKKSELTELYHYKETMAQVSISYFHF